MNTDQIEIVRFTEQHLPHTSDIHLQEMPDDLASKMGRAVVETIFHQGMLLYPDAVAYVACHHGQVIGFCYAQIDFAKFSRFQAQRWIYYPTVGWALVKRPWLFSESLAAIRYLKLEQAFTNVGPLAVKAEYRSLQFSKQTGVSVAGLLSHAVFAHLQQQSLQQPILTMIRPNNLFSITAVANAAKKNGYHLTDKQRIDFRHDQRLVFKYQL